MLVVALEDSGQLPQLVAERQDFAFWLIGPGQDGHVIHKAMEGTRTGPPEPR